MSRYDADDVYCFPGTAVLKNKAGITDQDLLDEYEGDFTAIRRTSGRDSTDVHRCHSFLVAYGFLRAWLKSYSTLII
jgi:hypothetical protein